MVSWTWGENLLKGIPAACRTHSCWNFLISSEEKEKWYIVLTCYCEKEIFKWLNQNFCKFEAGGREFAKVYKIDSFFHQIKQKYGKRLFLRSTRLKLRIFFHMSKIISETNFFFCTMILVSEVNLVFYLLWATHARWSSKSRTLFLRNIR